MRQKISLCQQLVEQKIWLKLRGQTIVLFTGIFNRLRKKENFAARVCEVLETLVDLTSRGGKNWSLGKDPEW